MNHVINVTKTSLSGFVFAVHLGMYKQYVYSFGLWLLDCDIQFAYALVCHDKTL